VAVKVTVPDDCWVPHPGLFGVATVLEVAVLEVGATEVAVLEVEAVEVLTGTGVVEVVVELGFDPLQAVNNRDTAASTASGHARLTAPRRPTGDVPSPICSTALLCITARLCCTTRSL
jgi:hypothetical protein